ncbi:MAG: HipA family kinase, partial [Gemmatimonadales bacterium]
TATRYVQPLREGGSLPAIVDTHGGGLYVAKFRGAGQGPKSLIAELVTGLLAQAAGLPTPKLALIDIAETFGRSEPDPEIQDLLRASHGINVGLKYLDGSFNFDTSAAGEFISPDLAAKIVWFDAFMSNPDRTHRNPNLLIWNRLPWLIDHGAALYAHHDWASVDEARTRSSFPLIKSHVLLAESGDITRADEEMAAMITDEIIEQVVGNVPDELLSDSVATGEFSSVDVARIRYVDYLTARIRSPRAFVTEAAEARERARRTVPLRVAARR